jgi:hypothetical protein
MPSSKIRFRVELELEPGGSSTVSVVVDQRDFAAVEAAEITSETKHTWMRYMAWNAMKRAGTYAGTWEAFNGRECVEVADEGPAGADDANNPGHKDRGAES